MKNVLVLAALMLAAVSCKKTLERSAPVRSAYLESVIAQLRDSLSPTDFERLDTTRGYLDTADGGKIRYFRVGFRGVSVAESFVLLRTDDQGDIITGRMVEMEDPIPMGPRADPGSLTLRGLAGGVLLQSEVVNGYVVAFHPGLVMAVGRRKASVLDMDDDDDDDDDGPWQTLPEAIVTPGGDGGSAYYDLGSLLGQYTAGGATYYGVANPSAGGGGGGVVTALMVKVPAEYSNSLPVINVQSYFNCFTQVPDLGATYLLQLCTDIPINGDPNESFDLSSGGVTVGHSFLVVTKSNTGVSVTQSFGFYPGETPAFWNPTSPVPSAIKDNGGHEINASITIALTAAQFATVQSTAIADAANAYSITNYNCTNYALGVFNSVASPPLTVSPFDVYISTGPGTEPIHYSIAQSPEGLYNTLASLQNGGGTLPAAIQVSPSGLLSSPTSHGACP